MRRPATLGVVTACATLAGLAAPTAAPAATFSTAVSIRFIDRPGPDIFRGTVTSPAGKCVSNRLVRLFRVQGGPDQLIDFDRSEDNGSWSIDIEGDPAPGTYYVRVPRRMVGGDVCAAAVSRRMAVAG
jgi:hypothetical protein